LSNKKLFLRYRKSAIPEGGWTHENFVGEEAEDLRQDMLLMRRAAILQGLRNVAPSLAKLMAEQVEAVVMSALNSFSRLYGISASKTWADVRKEDFDFQVPNEGGMWADAIEAEMARAGTAVTVVVGPSIHAVTGDVFGKVNLLLGAKPTRAQVNGMGVRSRSIVAKVGDITETTRTRLHAEVVRALQEGDTVFATAERIRRRIPQIATNRVPTIVRTELGEAADEAVGYSMEQSGTVAYFDVIGCEAIEPNIPTYKGIPTCNITHVPMRDRNLVRFHINHTGAIVAGGFFREDGSDPNLQLREGVGEGTPEGG